MSLKAVELQIAIPRSRDMGTEQQQHMQKPVQDQAKLSEHLNKLHELERQRSNKVDQSIEVEHREDPSANEQQEQDHSRKKKKQQKDSKEADKAQHPYKGRHIDFSL